MEPVYDFLPRPNPLLVSGGELFERGIYAHAPAIHRYDLEGDWKSLTGKCGLPTQRGGSVVFVIKTDGREVFRSPKVEPGTTHSFAIDLTNVKSLELTTENAGDGNQLDWGLWLEPTLTR